MTCNLKYTSLLLILLAAFAACSDEWWDTKDPDAGKSPIELSVGGVDMPSSQTRAVITDGTNKTLQAFNENTSLYMLMKSEDVSNPSNPAMVTRTIMFALPQSDNTKNYSEVNYSASKEYAKFVRYWEDSYSRSSALSILAICTPGMGAGVDQKAWRTGGDAAYSNQGWSEISGDDSYPQISWPIGTSETQDQSIFTKDKQNRDVDFIKNQDLCFSNNIGKYSESYDHRMKFNSNSDRKFDAGNLVFYHALSKLTFQIKMGEGYTGDGTDFLFDEGTNIKLQNFYNSGLFNIENGEFVNTTEKPLSNLDINKIYNRPNSTFTDAEKAAGYKYILDALVIPSTEMNDGTKTGVVFRIDGNEYKLSLKQLYDAIIANKSNWPTGKTEADYFDSNGTANTKLKAGIHYVFTFTVGKTKIEKITAQLMPWETVDAIDVSPDNAHVKLDLLVKNGEELKDGVDFYRGLNLYDGTGFDHEWQSYEWQTVQYEKATASLVKTTDPGYIAPAEGEPHDYWTTDWYWDSNRHFYHFRSLIPSGHQLSGNPIVPSSDPPSYNPTFELTSHRVISNENTYTNVQWGAPFLNTEQKLTYSTTSGFDGKGADAAPENHQIYWAIGPTKDEIKLISFHMMSEVTINFSTSDDGSAIDFGNGTSGQTTLVELRDCASTATVNMGDGRVVPNYPSAPIPVQTLANDITSSNKTLTWGIVPQTLEGKELRIVTPDGNEYLVDLGNIEVTQSAANPSNQNLANPYEVVNGKCKINYWYPNYKYTYNFKLVKMGIADLKATVVDWETVTADEETVQIQ